MPPVKQPKRPTIQKSTEERDVEKLAEVLWKHGDPTTEHCRREIVKAGIRMDEVTPTMLRKAEELNQERLREGFRNTNQDPKHGTKVVVPGDREFDPALNPDHPIRGAAKVKQEAEKERLAEITAGSPLTKEEKAERLKTNATGTAKKKKQVTEKGIIRNSLTGNPLGTRYSLLGLPATSVMRWMGAQGWSEEEVTKVVRHYGLSCSPATIKIQTRWGKNKEPGKSVPDLSPEQVKELKKIVGKR